MARKNEDGSFHRLIWQSYGVQELNSYIQNYKKYDRAIYPDEILRQMPLTIQSMGLYSVQAPNRYDNANYYFGKSIQYSTTPMILYSSYMRLSSRYYGHEKGDGTALRCVAK